MSDFFNDINTIKQKSSTLKTNKVARFSYTQTAYDNDEIAGVDVYQYTNEQNVPKDTKTDLAPTVIDKGVRSQSASLPRNAINHFFGRVSYNLNKITDWLDTILDGLLRSEAMNGHRYTSTTKYKQYDVCSFVDTTITPNRVRYFMRHTSDPVELSNYPPMVGSAVQTTHWQELSDVDTVDGYHAGNASGQIPISNDTVNTNLIAEKAVKQTLTTVSADTTLNSDTCIIEVTTANAVTLTIPSGLSIGHQYRIKRTVSSANGIFVITSGSETIEGLTYFTVQGSKVSATLDTGEVVLEKISSTAWAFVGGQVSGSNSNGRWVKFSDGTMIEYIPSKTLSGLSWTLQNSAVGTYGWSFYLATTIIYLPSAFVDTNYAASVRIRDTSSIKLATSNAIWHYTGRLQIELEADNNGYTTASVDCIIIGRWK